MWIVCAVLDKRAGEHGGLFVARTRQVAARMFSDMILQGPETIVRQHPEDFALDELGTFDEENGTLFGYEFPRLVVTADDAILSAQMRQQLQMRQQVEEVTHAG